MKAKLYIGIILVLLLSCSHLNGQNVAIVVNNNYYDDYDYHFSSRINRFHKSYSAFDYYAPVYTDTYWYSYQPSTWGMSIYGGGLAVGYSESYPVYNYPVYNYYDPYFGTSYYYGYNPYYTSYWYSPVIINVGWRNNYGWNRHNHGHYYASHRKVYNTYNNYNNNNIYNSSERRYTSTRTSSTGTRNTSGNISRRNDNTSGTDTRRMDEQSNNGRSSSGRSSSISSGQRTQRAGSSSSRSSSNSKAVNPEASGKSSSSKNESRSSGSKTSSNRKPNRR